MSGVGSTAGTAGAMLTLHGSTARLQGVEEGNGRGDWTRTSDLHVLSMVLWYHSSTSAGECHDRYYSSSYQACHRLPPGL